MVETSIEDQKGGGHSSSEKLVGEQDEAASMNIGDLSSSKRAWMADNVDEDSRPPEGPSKKKRRKGENEHFVGGMRKPRKGRRSIAQTVRNGQGYPKTLDKVRKRQPQGHGDGE